jgi:hypothetical protein
MKLPEFRPASTIGRNPPGVQQYQVRVAARRIVVARVAI